MRVATSSAPCPITSSDAGNRVVCGYLPGERFAGPERNCLCSLTTRAGPGYRRGERILAPITAKMSVTTATPASSNATTVYRCSSADAEKLAMKMAAMTAYRRWRRPNSSGGLSGASVIDAGRSE
jgi:expansin (peptidoglycan-binding protein)